jgi:voltage-gated potassium channel
MFILLKILHHLKTNNWSNILLFIVFIYVTGATLLFLEPETFTNVKDYSWWFVVTASTVGYGDLYPSTDIGRLIGVIVIFGGVGTLAMVISKVSDIIMNINRITLKGLKKHRMEGHTVLMGYHKEETKQIIDEILKDETDCQIIVCSDEIDEHPFTQYDCVEFVKGKLISDDVLDRACVDKASKILIHAPNDNESIAVLLAVLNHNHDEHTNIVLTMEDATYNKHVEEMVIKMNRKVETVTDLKIPMMVQSLLDSGASDIVNQMLSNDGSAIRSHVHKGLTFTFIEYSRMMLNNGVIVIGVNKNFHPHNDTPVRGGDVVYYFGHNRVNE